MKRNLILAFGLLTLLTIVNTSCKKLKNAAKINIELSYANIDFTIPTITAAGPATLMAKDVYLNVDSLIKANNGALSAGNIKSVTVKSCVITMIDGDANNNFSALQSAKADFKSNVNSNWYTIAEITNNPDVEDYEIEIPVNSSINLKDYFNATTFSYTIYGEARKATTHPIQCKATIKYNLEAGL